MVGSNLQVKALVASSFVESCIIVQFLLYLHHETYCGIQGAVSRVCQQAVCSRTTEDKACIGSFETGRENTFALYQIYRARGAVVKDKSLWK